ncbi:MAG: hypothetical protein WA397_12010, partial [Roseiarcus sp.]
PGLAVSAGARSVLEEGRAQPAQQNRPLTRHGLETRERVGGYGLEARLHADYRQAEIASVSASRTS